MFLSIISAVLIAGIDLGGLPAPEHHLLYDTPAATWDEALPLGNGTLGALVWGDGKPLKISLDRTDLWDLRPVPEFHSPEYTYATMQQWEREGKYEDLVKLYEEPYNRAAPTKIPAGRIELIFPDGQSFKSSELALKDPEAVTRLGETGCVQVWIHAEQPVGVIQMEGAAPSDVRLLAPPFGGKQQESTGPSIVVGELSLLGYPAPRETKGDTWRAFEQEGWEGFNFAVFLSWRVSGTGWIGAWSVASSAEGAQPLEMAKTRVEKALSELDALRASHRAWWEQYWTQSRVSVPDKLIEKEWYLDTYKFGAASRRGAPPITLQGPWTADDGKLPPWKGDYHHDLNTELSYWPCYSGNRLEEGLSYLDWLWATRENCKDWTKRFFGLPGMNVPMTGDLNNSQIGGWRQYTHSATTGAWLAHHFYLHWKYSMDRTFLKERAYPYLQDCAVFLEAVSKDRDANGKRKLPLSASPEIHDNKPNAWFSTLTNYDLALMRWLFGATAELADALGKADDAVHWRGVRDELPALHLAADGGLMVSADEALTESHRHFSHLMAVHPLGIVDRSNGREDQRIIDASLAHLDKLGTDFWCGYSFAWLGSMAARAGDGEKAANALHTFAEAFVLRNSFHANGDQTGKGHSKFTYRPFTLEGNFAAAAGLQEMLLQSHTGVIEIFPAIPESWQDAAFENLRAQGAFLVSAKKAAGKMVEIVITSEAGGPCKVRLPWSGEVQELQIAAGHFVVLLAPE